MDIDGGNSIRDAETSFGLAMRIWNREYWQYLTSNFQAVTRDLKSKLERIVTGRAIPSIENMPIGSARKMEAAVLFFDIKGSSQLQDSLALYTLNVVIPTIMRIVHDHDGYIEKNTGDGVMAIFTAMDKKQACKAALQSAMVMFSVLREVANPHLKQVGVPSVNARVGIDFGSIYISRVGTARGSSSQDRSFLTAIGPAANIACRLQEQSGINQIWVGNLVAHLAPEEWRESFRRVWPSDWTWISINTSDPYPAWHFDRQLAIPTSSIATLLTDYSSLPPPPTFPLFLQPSPPPTFLSEILKKKY